MVVMSCKRKLSLKTKRHLECNGTLEVPKFIEKEKEASVATSPLLSDPADSTNATGNVDTAPPGKQLTVDTVSQAVENSIESESTESSSAEISSISEARDNTQSDLRDLRPQYRP